MKVFNNSTGMQIMKSNDYSLLRMVEFNRGIDKNNLYRITKSITENGFYVNPIIVSTNMEIIDGQHRFIACRDLGIPFYYVIVPEVITIQNIHAVNTTGKKWDKSDYCESYSMLGKESYTKLLEFKELYPNFSVTVCELLLNPFRATTKKTVIKGEKYIETNTFSKGDFVVEDWAFSCKLADLIMIIKKYYSGYARVMFIKAIIKAKKHKNFVDSVFIHKLETFGFQIRHSATVEMYYRQIVEIYNYRNRGGKID